MTLSRQEILTSAKNCLHLEQAAIESTAEMLDDSFIDVLGLIEKAILKNNKLILTGVGKNVPVF
mgnify:CR=1 FL=1